MLYNILNLYKITSDKYLNLWSICAILCALCALNGSGRQ